ncbi:MAG: ribosome maturation factor RimM [Desulfarculales bacterium]|nr:ribosome maturation factor RimM [Desulfarculales bacterium]
MLVLGKIVSAFGLKGELKLFYHGSEAGLLKAAGRVWLGAEPQSARLFTIQGIRSCQGRLLISLHGVEDRDQAHALAGQWLFVRKNDLPPLAEDEFYLSELKGMEVRDGQGRAWGRVNALVGGGAQELLEIKDREGRKALLPLVKPLWRELDLEKRVLIFDFPPGLLAVQGWPEEADNDF